MSLFSLRHRFIGAEKKTDVVLEDLCATKISSSGGSDQWENVEAVEAGLADGKCVTPQETAPVADELVKCTAKITKWFTTCDGALDLVWKLTKVVTSLVGLIFFIKNINLNPYCKPAATDFREELTSVIASATSRNT